MVPTQTISPFSVGSNSWCRRICRENVVPTELRCHQLLFLVSHTHTRSSWILAPIPPNHPMSHPWNEGIDVPEEHRYNPYRATYDIEVMLQPTEKRRSEKLEWTSHHVLLSVSVGSNVPTYTEPICFIVGIVPTAVSTGTGDVSFLHVLFLRRLVLFQVLV
jgi:hypothetical protein